MEIKGCVTGAEQTSLQNCIQVNDTYFSAKLKSIPVRIIKRSFKTGDVSVEGKGQRY